MRLARCYANGCGVKEDSAEAFKFFLLAAEQGDCDAMLCVSVGYFHGMGTPENKEESLRWVLKAANQGHMASQHSLGILYAEGNGVKRNRREALKWFRKAAVQGSEEAAAALEHYSKIRMPRWLCTALFFLVFIVARLLIRYLRHS